MAEGTSKIPVKEESGQPKHMSALQTWRPFENLRREVDRLFEGFAGGFWDFPYRRRSVFDIEPFWQRERTWAAAPDVDIVEKHDAYEITAELPGMDEKSIEVKLANGGLTITGEKQEEKEEKKKDYYLQERHFGFFERRFAMPEGVNTDKIEANFKNGVLKVTLPKKPEAVKAEKKIEVKAS